MSLIKGDDVYITNNLFNVKFIYMHCSFSSSSMNIWNRWSTHIHVRLYITYVLVKNVSDKLVCFVYIIKVLSIWVCLRTSKCLLHLHPQIKLCLPQILNLATSRHTQYIWHSFKQLKLINYWVVTDGSNQ